MVEMRDDEADAALHEAGDEEQPNSGSTSTIGGSIWLAEHAEAQERAAGVEARKGIGHRGRQRQRDRGRAEGDDQAVGEPAW